MNFPSDSTPEFPLLLTEELTGNILPFWMKYVPDNENGGFYGAVSNTLEVHNDKPRSAVLCARILWTFSAAYRHFDEPGYLEMAKRAYLYLTEVFWDKQYGGVYWSVDAKGQPVEAHKHNYAQAFAIYGLSEYYRATRQEQAKIFARRLFELVEEHAFDPLHGGYIEGSGRSWGILADMRLSDADLNCRKSMNTLLHLLEAYTNLMRIWDDPRLARQHRSLLETFHTHVVDPRRGHLRLFFDDNWNSLKDEDSYGHDIEASWLMWEAAQMHNDPQLLDVIQAAAMQLAEAVYREGRDVDGSLFSEGHAGHLIDDGKAWWPQAEAMVGFYNVYQLSGKPEYEAAAQDAWQFIESHLIDRVNGDWFKQVDRTGNPDPDHMKVSAWDCPYHHARACLELIDRLSEPHPGTS